MTIADVAAPDVSPARTRAARAAASELERIKDLGRTEGARLRQIRPITEAEQRELRVLLRDAGNASAS